MANNLWSWIDAARTWITSLDTERMVWTVAALLTIAYLYYILVSSAWLRLLYGWRETLLRVFGDQQAMDSRSCKDKLGPSCNGKVASLSWATPDAVRSRLNDYRRVRVLGAGDVSRSFLAEAAGRRFVIKQAVDFRDDDRLLGEYHVIAELMERSAGTSYQHYLPWPIETFVEDGRRTAVYAWRDGFVDAPAIARRFRQGLDGRHLGWMFNRLLELLGHVHRLGWVHAGIMPPHLLFHAQNHGLQLLGWASAHRYGARLDCRALETAEWSPPESHRGRRATSATDIYMAARCVLWLSRGSDLSWAASNPLPRPVRELLTECVSASPDLRPHDAWALRDEFAQRLEEAYGPPRYCQLDI